MATLAAFFRRSDVLAYSVEDRRQSLTAAKADAFRLRPLPNEDVFLYCKRIDNSRLVREADPRSRADCWSTLGAACILVLLLTSMLAPGVGSILAGYKLQELQKEQQKLTDEIRVLDLEEARLRNPARLEELARGQKLVTPAPGQIIHLDGKADSSLALNLKAR